MCIGLEKRLHTIVLSVGLPSCQLRQQSKYGSRKMTNDGFLGCDNPESFSQVKTCLGKKGFRGFVSVKELRSRGLGSVSNNPGVYLVLRNPQRFPEFLESGTEGQFKGKSPNVSTNVLRANWVQGAFIVYVGNTGDLRTRIGQLIRFGAGRAVGHRGGRYLWQLNNSEYLQVCWKETAKEKSASEKSDILREFQDYYGSLPFANIQR